MIHSITGGNYCLAPPVIDTPSIRSTPFITSHGGSLPLYPDMLEVCTREKSGREDEGGRGEIEV